MNLTSSNKLAALCMKDSITLKRLFSRSVMKFCQTGFVFQDIQETNIRKIF